MKTVSQLATQEKIVFADKVIVSTIEKIGRSYKKMILIETVDSPILSICL